MIYLHKVLPFSRSPLFLFGAMVISSVFTRRRWLAVLAVAGLWLIALPVVSDQLIREVEEHSVRLDDQRMPEAAAVMVLRSTNGDKVKSLQIGSKSQDNCSSRRLSASSRRRKTRQDQDVCRINVPVCAALAALL